MESGVVLMEIIKGKIKSAQKVVVYGPEGIGKSTFASKFPDPLFIDTEESTKHLDVKRTPAPSSWQMLLSQVDYVKSTPNICKTLVIDTADWAEQLCSEDICNIYKINSIGALDYGKGFVYLGEEFGRLLNKLSDLIDMGIHVVFIAHAAMRKFEQPDEWGSYDRWELKLQKKTASLLKEWSDMVLFTNYKTYTVKDNKSNKIKAQGGKRVMYTAHHSCWDAKNRHDLDEELPFDFAEIAHCFDPEARPESKPAPKTESTLSSPTHPSSPAAAVPSVSKPEIDEDIPFDYNPKSDPEPETPIKGPIEEMPDHLKPLYDLAEFHHTPIEDVIMAVEYKGYYPRGTPIENYDPDFVTGVLISVWPQVFALIQELKTDKRSA
jgi:GTPase SAR1 family protein